MYEYTENNNQPLNTRAIITISFAIIIIPIVISIVSSTFQIINHISVEKAIESDVDDALFETVATRMQSSDIVIHQMGNRDNWYVVTVSSLSPNYFSSSAPVVLLKNNDTYSIKYIGTDLKKETLQKNGIPDDVIEIALSSINNLNYSSVLMESQYNPIKKYPLLEYLPYHTDNLEINYLFDDQKDSDGTYMPIITIKGQDAAERKTAMRKIKNLGFDPGDYRIQFLNFNNQFDKDTIINKATTGHNNIGE